MVPVADVGIDSLPPRILAAAGVVFILIALLNLGVNKSIDRHGGVEEGPPKTFWNIGRPDSYYLASAVHTLVGLGFLVAALVRAVG